LGLPGGEGRGSVFVDEFSTGKHCGDSVDTGGAGSSGIGEVFEVYGLVDRIVVGSCASRGGDTARGRRIGSRAIDDKTDRNGCTEVSRKHSFDFGATFFASGGMRFVGETEDGDAIDDIDPMAAGEPCA